MNQENLIEHNHPVAWLGQELISSEYTLGNLLSYLPEFKRETFGTGNNKNKYLQTIIRLPIGKDTRQIPVATVSCRYALIQHKEVFTWLAEGLKAVDYCSNGIPVEMKMSEYGERLHLAVHIPKFDFDPGDSHKFGLMVEIRNSVDRSCAFEVRLRWRRLVCLNGMWVMEEDILRKIHNVDWMNQKNVAAFINDRVIAVSGFKEMINCWLNTKITLIQIESWADDQLAKGWGVHLAARCCHIARTGYDGIVGRAKTKTPASQYVVSSDREVPGAYAPVKNLFHLSQVLTWLASDRDTVEDSDAKTSDIPKLLKCFIK